MDVDGFEMGFNIYGKPNMDFHGVRWIDMGLNMEKLIRILMFLDGLKCVS